MEFASVIFIEIFLPAVLIVYYLLGLIKNEKASTAARNIFLLLASLVFYAFGGINELLLFVALIALNFFAGIIIGAIDAEKHKKGRTAAFVVALLLNVGVLVYFKYTAMFVNMIKMFSERGSVGAALSGLLTFDGSGAMKIIMPLAISFIIFQSISYIADVFTKKTEPSKNILTFALYMTLLCQLTQGPIMRYGNLGKQIEKREHSLEGFLAGLKRFCYGLGKKVLIANVVAETVDKIFNSQKAFMDVNNMGAPIAWLGIVLYTIQIYYDFSGYTDMAIGVGGMLGFKIDENFNYPYTSFSVQEFWRRWHITLSSWFKDYIYIPMGGSRCSKARACFNVAVVFLVTGIWHGANLTFIVWGMIFVVFSIIERLFLGDLLKKNPVKPVNWLYTILVVMIGWVFFRSDNIDFAGRFIGQMFSFKASPVYSVFTYLSVEVIVALVCGILFSGALQRPLGGVYAKIKDKLPVRIIDVILQLAILAFCIIRIVGGSYAPSIYQNF